MTTKTTLSKEQRARIEVMAAVAPYCRQNKLMNISQADPFDLIRLSEYVLKGEDEIANPLQLTYP